MIAFNGIRDIAISKGAICVLDSDEVWCFGKNDLGQASPPLGLRGALAAGESHFCALMDDAGVKRWGDNKKGQSGPWYFKTQNPDLKGFIDSSRQISAEQGNFRGRRKG